MKRTILSTLVLAALITGCNSDDNDSVVVNPPVKTELPYFADWPVIESQVEKDQAIETEIANILSMMTLEEKVGQMVQPDLREVTPEEAKEYKLGSLLNGGGGWPNEDKYASAQDWASESDKYYLALEEAYEGRGFRIPFMWATDAVHGHNNVYRATVFPHNIGLGAARNADLIEKIGQATANEIVATGLDWTFAPTVATPRDYRWGRVYEGYSEDPEIVYEYAARMVQGLQGGAEGLKGQNNVISNVKHWVGDGGTLDGVDRGENHYSEEYLRNIHAMGYFSALDAGAQVVMTSFNSWHDPANYDQNEDGEHEYNYKIHGSKYLLNDVLKEKMGFDGLIVTDWNGHTEITGCTGGNCPEAVNAGNDVFMVTANADWKAFYNNVIAQVKSGVISEDRINDAVTRILRVKMRANLWEKPLPSQRTHAGDAELLGADAHRALARQAVSESLVLLKNENSILPLSKDQSFIVAGSALNDITKQTGGWTITWQGDGNTIEDDFPGAQTMLMALEDLVGEENLYTDSSQAPEESVAIVVIGEDPYAEMLGDIKANQTLEYSTIKSHYAQDLETIKQLKADGHKVVTVFYSGRPLYVNEEINNSDAFVAAWLPGTEAGGITDVLFRQNGAEFKGKLSYSWPKLKCSAAINRHAPNIDGYVTPSTEQDIEGEHQPLFPYGYGLTYSGSSEIKATEENLSELPLDPRYWGCGIDEPDPTLAEYPLEIFGRAATGEYIAKISGDASGWADVEVSNGSETTIGSVTTDPINYQHQQDAINVKFAGNVGEFEGRSAAQVFMQTPDKSTLDQNTYSNADSTLQFDIRMHSEAPESMVLSAHCGYPCMGEVAISSELPAPSDDWTTIKVPLACFEEDGMNFSMTDTAFLMYTYETVEFDLGNIRYVPKSDDEALDALSCDAIRVNR